MESATCRTVTTLEFQPNIKLAALDKLPISEDGEYQKFLNELQSYNCGYWKWLHKRRIREVFVVGSLKNPETGKIDKIHIKRKTAEFIELADCRRFDIKTGRSRRSLSEEPTYIFPVENQRVSDAWEPQSLRQRIERVLPALRLKDVRAYADVLQPNWHFGLFNQSFTGAADSLSEREEDIMAWSRKAAKKTIFDHLPGDIQEFRALVEMMERDAK